jgi:hypothetical protein
VARDGGDCYIWSAACATVAGHEAEATPVAEAVGFNDDAVRDSLVLMTSADGAPAE